jgi:hypothetical protein
MVNTRGGARMQLTPAAAVIAIFVVVLLVLVRAVYRGL